MRQLYSLSTGLICFLLFSVSAQAQPVGECKWSAGIVFSPDYAFRTFTFPDSAQIWKEFLDENDLPKFGYTTGISILYRLHPDLELESGLLYSNKGHRYRISDLEPMEENDPAVPLEYTATYTFRYLDVPFKLNWFFLNKQVRLFLSAGMSADLFLEEFTIQEAVFPDRTETDRFNEENVDYNVVAFSLSGGAGIEYPLSRHFFIRLNPEFRHGITPVADTSWKRYNWSVGLNTGLYYRLRHKGNIIFARGNNRKR